MEAVFGMSASTPLGVPSQSGSGLSSGLESWGVELVLCTVEFELSVEDFVLRGGEFAQGRGELALC